MKFDFRFVTIIYKISKIMNIKVPLQKLLS